MMGIHLEVSGEDWDDFKKLLQEKREKTDYHSFAVKVVSGAILNADEVHVPKGGGLELRHHAKDDLHSKTPLLPEPRSF